MKKFSRYFMWFIIGLGLVIVGDILIVVNAPVATNYIGLIISLCGGAFLIVALVYKMILLYSMYKRIYEGHGSASPGKAVGFIFIPAFNIYWVFYVYAGLVGRIRSYMKNHGIEHKMGACKWMAVLAILLTWVGPVASYFLGDYCQIVSIIGVLLMVLYLYKCTKAVEKIEEFQSLS
ncbi:MAG: hypothetical protein NTX05_05165, partial [Fusobacteria bacterium]|nr:hypothetical protein [Fusobacteriota bacterium]